MYKTLLTIAILPWLSSGMAQQTVGVFVHDPRAYPGYTLFAPSSSHNTYLIDNCGRLIHQWTSNFTPGQSVYLLTDGSILRTARINSTFQGGGSGGRIERISWDDQLLWAYNYSSANYHQHHDIEPLPDGNILILAWERKSQADAIAAGRNPATIPSQGLWPEHLVEISPLGANDAEIVWEWHVWDHLIQDYDSTKAGFGNVPEHPELIDLNFASISGAGAISDWLHGNSIDYHPLLDQILVSVHNFNELWVIDHSTTAAEAADHKGGNSGRGGDLLYRWGNPESYRKGALNDKLFYGQHNARWIEAGIPGEGQISVFNNNHGIGLGAYSSADCFLPPLDSSGAYFRQNGEPYGPTSLSWTYHGMPDNTFHSSRLSSVQRLPNGNTLICVGHSGKFIEVTEAGEAVWEYVSPVSVNSVVAQGDPPLINDIFHAERYPIDYEAFAERNLMPGEPLELNPLPLICNDTLSSALPTPAAFPLDVRPNPVVGTLYLTNPGMRSFCINIFVGGQLANRYDDVRVQKLEVNTINWPTGLIVVVCTDTESLNTQVMKLIKL